MRRLRTILLLTAALAMVAAACGDTTEVTVTSVVERPGETVVVTQPGETVVVTQPGETVVSVVIEPGTTIKFWSTETQPERLEITKGIIDRFTAATGVAVDLTAADENQLPELMITNAASGTLPDVVFHPVDFTAGWAAQGLLNPDAAAAVVDELGAETFSQGALDLATVDGTVAAVPSDGWGQLLVYRKDLFDAEGLAAPDTFDAIAAAAEALHDPGNDFFGITAATAAGEVFTQQTFEHFALANNCQLVNDAGEVTLDSDECVEAVTFFTDMMNNFSPGGIQDVVTTRATYFAGQAGMIVWSPFILDEMAGLRDAAFPACPECADNPAFLAEVSAIIPSFSGPSGDPAQYGQISLMGIGNTGNDDKTAAAQEFIKFWLSEGYLDWLSTSPEGKLPLRRGTVDNPNVYLDGWKALETGVDRKASLTDFYPADIIDTLLAGTENFDRWGFVQNQGPLVSAIYTSLPVPEAIRNVLDGDSVADAVADMQAAAEEELELLEE